MSKFVPSAIHSILDSRRRQEPMDVLRSLTRNMALNRNRKRVEVLHLNLFVTDCLGRPNGQAFSADCLCGCADMTEAGRT